MPNVSGVEDRHVIHNRHWHKAIKAAAHGRPSKLKQIRNAELI
jgi:hypothetical protein